MRALSHHCGRFSESQPEGPDEGALPHMQGVRKSKPRPNRAKLRRGNGETAAELANGPAAPDAAAAPSDPAGAAPTVPAPTPAEETRAPAVPAAAAADAAVAEQAAPAEPVRVGRLVPARRSQTGSRDGARKRKTASEVRPPDQR